MLIKWLTGSDTAANTGCKESDMAERLSLSLRGSSSRGNEKETGVTYTLKEGSAARGRLLETESEVTDDFFPFL